MNLKNFFKVILLSFYSPALYMDVIKKWHHWGLNFLLKFSIFITIIATFLIYIFVSMIDFNDESIKSILANIPELRISEGKAEFVNAYLTSPIIIKDENHSLVAVDLSTSDPSKYQTDNMFVFLKDKIYLTFFQTSPVDSSPVSVSYDELTKDYNVNIIDSNFLINFLDAQQKKVLNIILLIGIPLGSLIYFALTIIKVAFYSSIPAFVCYLLKLNLSFKQIVRVAIIANVPSVIISSIFSFLFFMKISPQIDQLIINAVYFFYFVGAIMLYLKKKVN